MVKICLVVTCYNRPHLVERLLDSVEKHCPVVNFASIVIEPEDYPYTPRWRRMTTKWVWEKQMPHYQGKNIAAQVAIDEFDPDILWITDDDVYAIPETHIVPVLPLLAKADTGTVAITRRMRKSMVTTEEDLVAPLPYIGGGYLVKPATFLAIGGFDNEEPAIEKDFTLRLYLAGFINYRTRRSMAIHEQGKAGKGGMYQMVHDFHEKGIGNMPVRDTQYNETHLYLQTEPCPNTLGKYKAPWKNTGAKYTLTAAAKKVHESNHRALIESR